MPSRHNDDYGTDFFPDLTVEYETVGGQQLVKRVMATGGLSRRDFFAGHALSGLLARGEADDLSAKAYAIADRMVEEAGAGG